MTILNKTKLSINFLDKIFVFLIFFDWILYENLLFVELDEIGGFFMKTIVYAFKLGFPISLFLYSKFPNVIFFKKGINSLFVFSFLFFIIWSFVPTLLYGNIISWTKLLPIFTLTISVISFFIKKPGAAILFMKIYIYYVLFSLVQYLFINIFHIYEGSFNDGFVGPFGLLGNTRSRLSFPLLSNPIIRLCGFWKEPSNAAGASFAAFFLAKFIFEIYSNKFWKIASYLCLIAGFLTLSNAGYLSIGISSLIGFFLNNRKTLNKKIVTYIIIVPIIISMIWLALFSRDYFYKHPTENVFLLAITGVRSANTNENFDPTDGRFDLLALTYNTISKNFIGVGIQVTGPSGINSPAGAPLFWLFLTGIPGLLLISLRELAVYSSIRKSIAKCNSTILLGQAFFAILTQQAIYGSWMDPNYVIFASLILVFKEVDISVLKKIN